MVEYVRFDKAKPISTEVDRDGNTVVTAQVGYHEWSFVSKKGKPVVAFPLKDVGEIEHRGWDTPQNWAVDANNNCWIDNAHGPCLHLKDKDVFIEHIRSNDGYDDPRLLDIFGIKPSLPDWAVEALDHGWTPPKDFSVDNYRLRHEK